MIPLPALDYQEEYWTAETDGLQSRASMARTPIAGASGFCSSAIPKKIADIDFSLPSDLAAVVSEATTDLAALSSHSRSTFGSNTPLIDPMSAILLRTEASSSSQIENLTVGARQLALALVDQSRSSTAQLVLKNVRAMEQALEGGKNISEDTVLAIHHEILAGDDYLSEHAGQYRKQLVWIGGSNISPRSAEFVAPQPDLIQGLMKDLVAFMRRQDLPPLVQAAIAHAQFETIHPFVDGNGRVGRALVHALLSWSGPLGRVTAPISAGLLRAPGDYIAALTDYRQGDAGPIVEQFALASIFAGRSGMRLIDQLAAEVEGGKNQLEGLRSDATAWKVLPLLVANPVVTSGFVQAQLGVSARAALAALDLLEARGVVTERTGLKRNRVWQHDGILALLDGYAEQLQKR